MLVKNYIVIGSTALARYNKDRKFNDFDFVFLENVKPVKDKILDGNPLPKEIFDLIPCELHNYEYYATLDALYTIKLSHMSWNIFWLKHYNDILWMRDNGAVLIEPLFTKLQEHWKQVHGGKDFLSLNKSKDSFFDDFVDYEYDHDYLHELVAFPNKPMYTYVLKDGEQVLVDKNKFDELSFEDQLELFREEITVIACERFLLPGRANWRQAYVKALQLTTTNLTKNWANVFILKHLEYYRYPVYRLFSSVMHKLGVTVNPFPIELIVNDNLTTKGNILYILANSKTDTQVLNTLGNLKEILITLDTGYYRCFIFDDETMENTDHGLITLVQKVTPKLKTIHTYE